MTQHRFMAIWPIVDESVEYHRLCREAADDLPNVLARTGAQVTGPGRFSIAPSVTVPGSGRITDSVLIYEAPGVPIPRRPYHARTA